MLDFDAAQTRLAQAGSRPNVSESCPLDEASGRILANSIIATLDLPPADNSAMDGYAIRYADYAPGKALPVQQRCYAGDEPQALLPGNTIRLFTGSLMPEGADTVVMQEDCTENDDLLIIETSPRQHAHVRKQGEDVEKGQTILSAGSVISAAHIAMLASQGYAAVPVFPLLRVGILTTGDELVHPGQRLARAQIYNSNGPMLASLAKSLGAHVVHVLHALDTHASLDEAFAALLSDCDLVLTVGGVSVGEKDLIKPSIENQGGTLDLWRVSMKPGKPVALAHVQNTPIVCLPGNPVSAYAVFVMLVSPLIRNMQGRDTLIPPVRFGRLSHFDGFNKTRDEFIRVQASNSSDGMTHLVPYAHQASGIISSLPWSSGLARIPADTVINEGDPVSYYDWADWLR